MTKGEKGAGGRRKARRLGVATLALGGVVALGLHVRSGRPTEAIAYETNARASIEAPAPAITTRIAVPARRGTDVPAPDDDDTNPQGDYVGALVPTIRDWAKPRQLEALKQMRLWPGDKLAFQFPNIVSNPHLSPEERRAMADEVAGALVESLENEGVRYDLPPGFQPVGAAVPPPPADSYPPRE